MQPRPRRQDGSEMTSKDLIQAAELAQTAFDDATTQFGAAAQQVQEAQATLTDAQQAVYDDLTANGACVLVDETTTPVTVTLYTAADPNTYTSKEIRVAE
jgi:hypothetical protein